MSSKLDIQMFPIKMPLNINNYDNKFIKEGIILMFYGNNKNTIYYKNDIIKTHFVEAINYRKNSNYETLYQYMILTFKHKTIKPFMASLNSDFTRDDIIYILNILHNPNIECNHSVPNLISENYGILLGCSENYKKLYIKTNNNTITITSGYNKKLKSFIMNHFIRYKRIKNKSSNNMYFIQKDNDVERMKIFFDEGKLTSCQEL